jgi:hypothetical protein
MEPIAARELEKARPLGMLLYQDHDARAGAPVDSYAATVWGERQRPFQRLLFCRCWRLNSPQGRLSSVTGVLYLFLSTILSPIGIWDGGTKQERDTP